MQQQGLTLHFQYFVAISVLLSNCLAVKLNDVTNSFFGSDKEGIIGAYGDFNADKHTDIFVISEEGMAVDVLLAPKQAPYLEYNGPYTRHNLIPKNDSLITSLVPGDFDGDAQMDLLVTRQVGDKHTVQVYWGETKKVKVEGPHTVTEELLDQPLVLDYNADMLPDILGEIHQHDQREKTVWLSNHTRGAFNTQQLGSKEDLPMKVPHANSFLDINNDFNADLILTVQNEKSETEKYETQVWSLESGNWQLSNITKLDTKIYQLQGQAVFADFNGDSFPDQVLPVCLDLECKKSKILINSPAGSVDWQVMVDSITHDKRSWGFVPPQLAKPDDTPSALVKLPITLRVGDFNLDGMPDLVGVLLGTEKDGKTPIQEGYIFENVACETDSCRNPTGRTFKVNWDDPIKASNSSTKIQFAGAFDLYENGILDLLVVETHGKQAFIRAIQNQFNNDACFFKIMVVSGLCSSNCPNGQPPYGVNQPGPSIKYQTIGADGSQQQSCAAQLSQSAYFALQLPFTVFGLGMSPNFVDKLTVGIPAHSQKRVHTWTQVIPNSQLIVIPYPINQPSSWKNKLFLTPSRLVLLTAAALVGTCGFIAGIIGLLHWQEKREDKVEKRQDAHKFHFDAM